MNQRNTLAQHLPSTLVIGGKKVDNRRFEAKRFKAVCAGLANDIGGEPSTALWLLIQRAAALSVQAELLEVVLATGGKVDTVAYTKITSSLIRVLSELGLTQRVKDETPSNLVIEENGQIDDLSMLTDDELEQLDNLTRKIESMNPKKSKP